MKKYILTLLFLFISGCASYKYVMYNEIDATFNKYQIDSLCDVNNIPDDLSYWKNVNYLDYETNALIQQYLYIVNDSVDATYTITILYSDSLYKFKKRITKKIKQ